MSVLQHSMRRAWLLVLLTVANPLLHKTVSDACDWARGRWGFAVYERTALIAIPLLSIVVVSPLLARKYRLLLRPPTLAGVAVLGALTVAAQRWLMVVNIELIHLPQFGLIAAVALSLGLSGPMAFLTGIAAGIVDEAYQHFVVYAGRSDTYFDINDIVLNAIGAAWAVVLLPDRFRESAAASRGALTKSFALIALIALVAAWFDPPHFSPFFRMTPASQKVFRVLSAPEGVVVCGCLWVMVGLMARRSRAGMSGQLTVGRAGALCTVIPIIVLGSCARARAQSTWTGSDASNAFFLPHYFLVWATLSPNSTPGGVQLVRWVSRY